MTSIGNRKTKNIRQQPPKDWLKKEIEAFDKKAESEKPKVNIMTDEECQKWMEDKKNRLGEILCP